MTHRSLRGLIVIAIIVVAAGTAAAQECRLDGLVATEDGTPAPGVTVMLVRGRFKPQMQRVTSGDDGRFSLPSAECGDYRLFAPGMTTVVTVDTRKQSSVSVVVTRAMAASARREKEEQAEPPPPPASSDQDREDERTAALYRERFVKQFGSAEDLDLYMKAPTAERRAQVFMLVVTRRLFGIESAGQASSGRRGKRGRPDSADDETERIARAARADQKALVATMLSESAAASFDTDPPLEQARKAISAAKLALLQMHWPSATLLIYTDVNSGKILLKAAFGAGNSEVHAWDTQGNLRWRGELLQRALIELCDQAIAFVERDSVTPGLQMLFDESTQSAAESLRDTPTQEKKMIAGVFGRAASDEYDRLTPPRRQQLVRLAVLMSVSRIYDPPGSIERR